MRPVLASELYIFIAFARFTCYEQNWGPEVIPCWWSALVAVIASPKVLCFSMSCGDRRIYGIRTEISYVETISFPVCRIFDVREDEKPPVKDDDDKNKGHVLRLRGLPYNATPDDIKAFFHDITLSKDKNAIVISVSPTDKKPQGEAYVDFESDDAYREALKRNKQKIGERYIELFPSSRGDLKQQLMAQQGGRGGDQAHSNNKGRARQVAPPPPLPPFPQAMPGAMPVTGPQAATDGSTVKLRGLPFSATVDEIVTFFAGESSSSFAKPTVNITCFSRFMRLPIMLCFTCTSSRESAMV